MNEREQIQFLHDRRNGRDDYPEPQPAETTYLAPDDPMPGRFVNLDTGEREISA